MKTPSRVLAGLTLVLAWAGPALAQVGTWPPYGSRPTVSPYLNMLRGGNSAINYYGVVRPQVQTALTLQRLQFEQNYLFLGQSIPATSAPLDFDPDSPPSTGHPVQFMNSSRYFPQTPARTGSTLMPAPRGGYRR